MQDEDDDLSDKVNAQVRELTYILASSGVQHSPYAVLALLQIAYTIFSTMEETRLSSSHPDEIEGGAIAARMSNQDNKKEFTTIMGEFIRRISSVKEREKVPIADLRTRH